MQRSFEFVKKENKGYDYNNFWKYSIEKFGDLSFYNKVIEAVVKIMSKSENMDLTNWFIDWGILNRIVSMAVWNLDG